MKKISEAGKLYLQDFYILNEAQNDVFAFLNEIINQVYENVSAGIDNLTKQNLFFKWHTWKNVSKPGMTVVWPAAKKEFLPFRKGSQDLYLTYCDARHVADLTNTASVSVTIRCINQFAKQLKQIEPETLKLALENAEAHGAGLNINKKNLLSKEVVMLNLDSVSDSVELISEAILERCQGMDEFISEIIKTQ